MTVKDIQQFLKRVKVFKGLSDRELKRVAGVVRVRSVREGVTVFAEGDRGRELFLVHSGEIRITKHSHDGADQDLARLGPGSMFGEMALLEGHTRSAGAVAVEDTVLFSITKRDFEGLVNTKGSAAGKILFGIAKLLSVRLRKMDEEFTRAIPGPETADSIEEVRERLSRLRQNLSQISGL